LGKEVTYAIRSFEPLSPPQEFLNLFQIWLGRFEVLRDSRISILNSLLGFVQISLHQFCADAMSSAKPQSLWQFAADAGSPRCRWPLPPGLKVVDFPLPVLRVPRHLNPES